MTAKRSIYGSPKARHGTKFSVTRLNRITGKHKYFVSVFESGDRELLSDTTLLLRHNLELQMKAEPATEQVQA